MNAEGAMSAVRTMQAAFNVISALQMTASMWPPSANVQDNASFDFIIVGAGTAGSVIANRLTENEKTSVLLIEAGGDPPIESNVSLINVKSESRGNKEKSDGTNPLDAMPLGDLAGLMIFLKDTRNDWNYTSEHDANRGQCHQKAVVEMTQGKMLGGTSSLNFQNYGRGYAKDYDFWAEVSGDDTWKWDNVLPYFIKSEKINAPDILSSPGVKFHGTDGNVGASEDNRDDIFKINEFLNAYKELGHDIVPDVNEDKPLGYSKLLFTVADGLRQSSAIAYLSKIKKRKNLFVLKNTMATKIIFDENKNAVGVECVNDDKKITVKANKEVIVSAGALNTPKLLMLSGIGPKQHLESKKIQVLSDVPVGQNLQDLIGVTIVHIMEKQDNFDPLDPADTPAPGLVGYATLDKAQKHPDYETLHFIINTEILLIFCSFAFRYSFAVCDDIYKPFIGRKAVFNQVISLDTKSRGQIMLKNTNPFDQPIIETNYLSNAEDIDNLVNYIEHFAPIINTTYYKSVGGVMADPTSANCKNPGTPEYWKCYVNCMVNGMSYYTGTCAMGAVVDGKLKVKSVNRLRVADASVIPKSIRSNPSNSIVMIGEKVADFIKEEYEI